MELKAENYNRKNLPESEMSDSEWRTRANGDMTNGE